MVGSERAVVEWWIRDSGPIEGSRHSDQMCSITCWVDEYPDGALVLRGRGVSVGCYCPSNKLAEGTVTVG
jgi:hypothetical protein